MKSANFSLSIEQGIARITLCRPEQLNTFTDAFWGELSAALEELDQRSDVRVLLLDAQGPHFNAGMDLDFFTQVRSQEQSESGRYREWLRRKIRYLQKPMDQMEALRVPVIAATHGACLGAGLDLICAADVRLCSADAYFSIHEINVAITADLGVLQRMPRLVAPALVHDMALTGRKLTAQQAVQAGFVRDVADDAESLQQQATALAQHMASLSPLAMAGTKTALMREKRRDLNEALDYMSAWNAAMFVSQDVPEAIQAQQSQRRAQFQDLLA